jgi:4-amino-4-deoxy-L-arabinose transferase-like glycosyltransferase
MRKYERWILLAGFLFLSFLRLYRLGYSDYINDEPGTFMYGGNPDRYSVSKIDFFLSRKKGPLQIVIGYIPYAIVGHYHNEFAQRLPFAVANIFALIVFYLVVHKLTASKLTAFLATAFLSVNGFVVAFGRVAQYQSLNMLFSFLAVYCYSFVLEKHTKLLPLSLLGTFFYCMSVLSHWDAVYILPVIVFIYTKFLFNKTHLTTKKVTVLVFNFLLGCLLLLPFLIPYLSTLSELPKNQEYLTTRIGLKESSDSSRDIFRFNMYNPFLGWPVYLIGTIVGILFDIWAFLKKKNMYAGMLVIWLSVCLVVFKFFIPHSGTHIYNMVIPSSVLIAIVLSWVISQFRGYTRIIPGLPVAALILFFYYQSYMIFIDSTNEYPWERELIFGLRTRKYTHEDNVRHLIGFPKFRNWDEVNNFIMSENDKNSESLGYITNEDKGISGFYVDADYNDTLPYYAVGVKKPLSFQNDYKFSQIKNKKTVKKIEIDGETMVRIYRVDVDTTDISPEEGTE